MPDASAVSCTELFGSFVLGDDEFALPASCFREVVNYPEKVTALPLSPKFLEGVFTLRGSVIPVLNLGRVFDAGARGALPTDKIAILDYEGVLVGILFDATGEILRVRPEQRSTLAYAEGEQRGVVAGTILLDQGARLVQVLDPNALIHIENVPQVLALQCNDRQTRRRQGERRQCVSFRVGVSSLAFEMGAIQEIIRVPELQASVLNSALCLGRINFRGAPVAVVDFATLLNAGAAGERVEGADQRIIVARIDDATIGFRVDSVDNIVNFYSEELMAIPMLSKARAGMFAGCLSKPELGDIFFLDHQQIFSSTEIKDMRTGHAALYPKDAELIASNERRDARRSQRQVYISFWLENSYAVEIKQVREIIDFSVGEITRPPGLPAFMRGMLNLRQQMITVIDLRGLYGMAPLEDTGKSKILVVDRGDECYGLMVDAVENIMTIEDSKRYGAPKMMRNPSAQGDPRTEMDEVIDVGEGESRRTLSVFQCDRLLERLGQEIPALAA